MRRAVLYLLAAGCALGQGTSVAVNTWVTASGATGYPALILGFEQMVHMPSTGQNVIVGTYKQINNEANDAFVSYSYQKNKWEIVDLNGPFHSEYFADGGHPVGLMAWDSTRNVLVYIGGDSGGNNFEKTMYTWWYDPVGRVGRDKESTPKPLPSASYVNANAMVYDSTRDKIHLFWDYLGGVSTYTPSTNIWAHVSTTGTPPEDYSSLQFPSMIFRPVDGKVWLFGGSNTDNAVYVFDPATNAWSAPTITGTPPSARKRLGMAYSTAEDKILIVGGINSGGTRLGDTWVLDPSALTWTQKSPTGTFPTHEPAERLSYDIASNAFVMVTNSASSGFTPGAYLYCLTTCLNYGRTSDSSTTSTGSINFYGGTAGTESWAFHTALATDGTNIAAAWTETGTRDTGTCTGNCALRHPFVKVKSGSTWSSLGSDYLALDSESSGANDASNTTAAYAGSTLWVAWSRIPQTGNAKIIAKYWTGSAWTGGEIGVVTSGAHQGFASLSADGSTPVMGFTEWASNESLVYVKAWDGDSWELRGSALNIGGGTIKRAEFISASGAWVCWTERQMSDRVTVTTTPQVYCKEWGSGAWQTRGSSLNVSTSNWAKSVSLVIHGGQPYVAWTERTTSGNPQVYVKTYSGGSWSLVGGSSALNRVNGWAYRPQLATDGTTLYLAWEEQTIIGVANRVYAAKLVGSTWTALNTTNELNKSISGSAAHLALTATSAGPVAVWGEVTPGTLRQAVWAAPTLGNDNGLGSSTYTCVDVDGDGYGTGATCLGRDSDDLDASVHTASEAVTKYGTFENFLRVRRGYAPTRYWVISSSGTNNAGCVAHTFAADPDPTAVQACATYAYFSGSVVNGDLILWRGSGSTYPGVTVLGGASSSATRVYMAYPGENVTIGGVGGAITADTNASYLSIEGFKAVGAQAIYFGSQGTATTPLATNIIVRYNEATGACGLGCITGMYGLGDILIEYNVTHDNTNSHGVYLGSIMFGPNERVTYRRNISYRNGSGGWTGIQHNGRCLDCVFEQNYLHSNGGAGLSLEMGTKDSVIRGNLIFSNGNHQIVIWNYDDSAHCSEDAEAAHVCAYDQSGNLFESNTIYVSGGNSLDGADSNQQLLYAIHISNSNYPAKGSFANNTFRNNIFVNYTDSRGGIHIYERSDSGSSIICGANCLNWLSTSTFQNNVFWKANGVSSTAVLDTYITQDVRTSLTCSTLSSYTTNTGCSAADPLFAAASPSYWNSVGSFNFRLTSGSPARNAGAAGTTLYDVTGDAYAATPSLGAYESLASGGGGSSTQLTGRTSITGRVQP
jgi:hypothetical protein